ncbi:hypothetical protein WDU94_001302 [Cyamophila willieti]
MLSRSVSSAVKAVVRTKPQTAAYSAAAASHGHGPVAKVHYDFFPNREVVGYGWNGEPGYMDTVMFPYSSVRFRAITKELEPLKQKEKGDWKNLTLEEKKTLYRASFCQTFAEMEAPTGEWKAAYGIAFMVVSISLLTYVLMEKVGIFPEKAETLSDEHRQKMLQTMIDLKWNPITGTGSRWDYEKNEWKK